MSDAVYRNHHHYIREGWSEQPKDMFVRLADMLIEEGSLPANPAVLDVGCATGELLGYLQQRLKAGRLAGVDVAPELLDAGRGLLPEAEFVEASALALPDRLGGRFDLVTAIGCMSIFDESQIETFWRNLLRMTRPGGVVVALSPLNEFGVDCMIRHRKRRDGKAGSWETGWNIFAIETIRDLLADMGLELQLEPFRIGRDLPRREDPVRTWTMHTEDNNRQLRNGLKLMIDHYFMTVHLPAG